MITLQAWNLLAQETIRFCAEKIIGHKQFSMLATGSTRRQDFGPDEQEIAVLVTGVSNFVFGQILRRAETHKPGRLLQVVEHAELSNQSDVWTVASWDDRMYWKAHCFVCPSRHDVGHALLVTTGPPEFTGPVMKAYLTLAHKQAGPHWEIINAKGNKAHPTEQEIFARVGLPFVWPSLRHTEEAIAEAQAVLRQAQERSGERNN